MNIFGSGRNRRGGPGGGLNDKFEKFTERAQATLRFAQEEAQRFHHNYIGTEHLLLGLMREPDGLAVQILEAQGVHPNKVRAQVEFIIGRGDRAVLGEIGLTPRAKKVMELAVDEARRMNHHYVGTEHLLLGLIREGEGIAAGVLASLGVQLETIRTATVVATNSTVRRGGGGDEWPRPPSAPRGSPESLGASVGGAPASGPRSNVVACRLDDATLEAIDALVEAGIRNTRSDAAAWLIGAGIEAHRPLFERVNATVGEIRRLRIEAQAIAQQVRQETANGGASPAETGATAHDGEAGAETAPDEAPDSSPEAPDEQGGTPKPTA